MSKCHLAEGKGTANVVSYTMTSTEMYCFGVKRDKHICKHGWPYLHY